MGNWGNGLLVPSDSAGGTINYQYFEENLKVKIHETGASRNSNNQPLLLSLDSSDVEYAVV